MLNHFRLKKIENYFVFFEKLFKNVKNHQNFEGIPAENKGSLYSSVWSKKKIPPELLQKGKNCGHFSSKR